MRFRSIAAFFAVLTLAGVLQMGAQTITTGELAGTITDPSGAVVANANIELRNLDEGSISNAQSS